MSKNKKMSLSGGDTTEKFIYKPKDLIWAKMKGFTPWPGMIVEPPLDLLTQQRRANTKCVFFFGSRNFAWIEENNIKPFEGPWKEELAKVSKPAAFRHAMADIDKYIDDPAEVDDQINESCGVPNHATEADFDKIRDAVDSDENAVDADADANNGVVVHVVGSPDVSEAVEGENNADSSASPTVTAATPATAKSPAKRTPKAKPVSAVSATKAAKASTTKSAQKRRISAHQTPTGANTSGLPNAKRGKRVVSGGATPGNFDGASSSSPTARRRVEVDDLLASLAAKRAPNAIALLDRPVVTRPETQAIDMNSRSNTLADRDIVPSELTFGFLGLGMMGSTIVKDLIYTGHKVVVWNRTIDKCQPFVEAGAEVKDTPMDVVEAADIIFCCVSDPKGAKDLVFGNCGVLQLKDLRNKAYVEMSTVDPDTSLDIGEGIKQCNGRYLEAQIHGSRQEAADGMLIILAGGDRTVFEECHSCFKTIAKNTFFLGNVGNACKVNLILQTIQAVSLVGLAEALALADRFSISLNDIIDIFDLTSMKSPLLLAKGKEMAKGDFNPQQPLSHMQRDLRLVLNMAENLDQSMPVTSITNEVFKHTKRLGYSEHDSSAVFVRSRF
ncbi:putative oxidoreductase GLYR1 homolog isoform X2 [Drosophila persimilis]|uniref:Cytokine-like nuclear factor N-PAC n=2 Tax=Drosophila pseudoobscura pseudoobscura TaxID=46245 RepID=GLYR1_DROPS|nr:putative oxidoreductase GLYR1 homolog isoform X2 [Drosophila pseudoobscura]XP_026844896.1 putative oxidoreductase GLYR1 homolog isoform X2 [Drosophila persimilis]Q29NG1.2 RecName: Full=Cytokine-like nuclear factor N-PAC; Short=NPAC; AltName: Full=Glyoxylate reductase 1 homolog; AltName: Full=Nuclear protein NP60 homolog; AltName: Full=Putative oxidoreductase GLYR1 homolog [Drosophila pseudoobscura pseudoobscura]